MCKGVKEDIFNIVQFLIIHISNIKEKYYNLLLNLGISGIYNRFCYIIDDNSDLKEFI